MIAHRDPPRSWQRSGSIKIPVRGSKWLGERSRVRGSRAGITLPDPEVTRHNGHVSNKSSPFQREMEEGGVSISERERIMIIYRVSSDTIHKQHISPIPMLKYCKPELKDIYIGRLSANAFLCHQCHVFWSTIIMINTLY